MSVDEEFIVSLGFNRRQVLRKESCEEETKVLNELLVIVVGILVDFRKVWRGKRRSVESTRERRPFICDSPA